MMTIRRTLWLIPLVVALSAPAACMRTEADPSPARQDAKDRKEKKDLKEATFGSGCFWCTEAVFEALKGVVSAESGYSGGHVENPTYEQVCGKKTGHAEVCRIVYDPKEVTYTELLEVFFKTHNPTTKDRQGNDEGPQYRSVIFTHDEEQKATATKILKELDASGAWDKPLVTAIEPLKNFYPAEKYHQDYFAKNPNQGYCAYVIRPKMEKFRKVFKDKLKK